YLAGVWLFGHRGGHAGHTQPVWRRDGGGVYRADRCGRAAGKPRDGHPHVPGGRGAGDAAAGDAGAAAANRLPVAEGHGMDQTLIIGLLAATLRIATPILLAALGEVLAERAGVLNLGIEGIMLLGALVGFMVGYLSQSLWLGLLAAMFAGLLAGLLMAWLAVSLGLNQHVSGLGVTLLAS